jgi:hypothetical protein
MHYFLLQKPSRDARNIRTKRDEFRADGPGFSGEAGGLRAIASALPVASSHRGRPVCLFLGIYWKAWKASRTESGRVYLIWVRLKLSRKHRKEFERQNRCGICINFASEVFQRRQEGYARLLLLFQLLILIEDDLSEFFGISWKPWKVSRRQTLKVGVPI